MKNGKAIGQNFEKISLEALKKKNWKKIIKKMLISDFHWLVRVLSSQHVRNEPTYGTQIIVALWHRRKYITIGASPLEFII